MRPHSSQKASAGWLSSINPVFKLAAVLPPLAILPFLRDIDRPAAMTVLAAILLLSAVSLRWRTLLLSIAVVVLFGTWTTLVFSVLARPELVAHTPVVFDGWITLHAGSIQIGAATTVRLIAIGLVALLGSLGTTTSELISALTRQCRIPYRFAYGAVAAAQFVPRYRQDLITMKAAQRARGVIESPGPVGYSRRIARSLVPLLAGGARYAERLSLSMDARGFGAHQRRTERQPAVVHTQDIIYVIAAWAVVGSIMILL